MSKQIVTVYGEEFELIVEYGTLPDGYKTATTWLPFKLLAPKKPMPELKRGYTVYLDGYVDLHIITGQPCVGGDIWVCDCYDSLPQFLVEQGKIKKVICPHRGCIWTRGE